jgi:hypothetical protein
MVHIGGAGNTCDDFYGAAFRFPAAFLTLFNLYREHSFQALCPCHRIDLIRFVFWLTWYYMISSP